MGSSRDRKELMLPTHNIILSFHNEARDFLTGFATDADVVTQQGCNSIGHSSEFLVAHLYSLYIQYIFFAIELPPKFE